jgi:hypothetical protein
MDNILFPVGRLDRVIVPEDPRIDAWKNSFYRLDAILRPHYDIAQLYTLQNLETILDQQPFHMKDIRWKQ